MEIRFKHSCSFFNALTALLKSAILLLSMLCLAFFAGCKKEIDYRPYVSELRSNILLASEENFSLRIYAVDKESPYIADGIPRECNMRVEVYLTAPEGKETCNVFFTVDGQEYGGEMSYDNVKAEYYYFCSLDVSTATEIDVSIVYGETSLSLTAKSVLQDDILSPKAVISASYFAMFSSHSGSFAS